MRKQTRVLAAAALFTLGASFSAFAAKKGTWVLEDEGWMCLDSDGVAYTDEWCLSNGKEFYVDSDGYMVTSSWIDDGDARYFVNSEGTKTINDWRFLAPYDDEDADYEWFYFGNKGKMVSNAKKVIGSKTYYFNTDGVMLTGWVDTTTNEESGANVSTSNLVYCDEDGARIMSDWIYVYEPGVDEDEDDLDQYDEHWYYLKSNGNPVTGKKANLKNKTYLFNTNGEMLTGWVKYDGTTGVYDEIGIENQTNDLHTEVVLSNNDVAYFCDADNGYVKKDRWIKTWNILDYYDEDNDDNQYWFYAQTDGAIYMPDSSDTTDSSNTFTADLYKLVDGHYQVKATTGILVTNKTINKKIYAFNEDGEMLTGFVEDQDVTIQVAKSMYYYGEENDGVRKTGSVTATDDCGDSYKFYFATDEKSNVITGSGTQGVICAKAAGITGAMNGKLYDQGLLVKATDYKYANVALSVNDGTSTGKTAQYIVNTSGTIQTSYKNYTSDIIDTAVDVSDTTGLKDGFSSSITAGFNKGYEDGSNADANFLLKGAYNVQ